VKRISELGTKLAITSQLRSSETSILITAKQSYIPEDDILHSHRRKNLISYKNRRILHINKSLKQKFAER
jgi:hypothetical protein